jgi:hypothetical protein
MGPAVVPAKNNHVDPDTLGTGKMEVWIQSETSQAAPFVWFSPQGMQICRAKSGFTTCQLVVAKPLTLAKLEMHGYYMDSSISLEHREYLPRQTGISPDEYLSTFYRPKTGSFPPEGWGEYRTAQVTHDSLVKSIQGKWYLASVEGQASILAQTHYDSAYAEADGKGALFFERDSVKLKADSAGTQLTFATRFEIDSMEHILTDSLALPEHFMQGMPLLNPDVTRSTGLPEQWIYDIRPDTLRFARDYMFTAGRWAADINWGRETLVFLRATVTDP